MFTLSFSFPNILLDSLLRPGGKIDFNIIKIERELGRGAFGIIFRGVLNGEVVAVKQYVVCISIDI